MKNKKGKLSKRTFAAVLDSHLYCSEPVFSCNVSIDKFTNSHYKSEEISGYIDFYRGVRGKHFFLCYN